jgi:hypothetical protein
MSVVYVVVGYRQCTTISTRTMNVFRPPDSILAKIVLDHCCVSWPIVILYRNVPRNQHAFKFTNVRIYVKVTKRAASNLKTLKISEPVIIQDKLDGSIRMSETLKST